MMSRTNISKIFLSFLLPVVCGVLLNGCSQNGGHIGDYFGTWVISEITVDNEPLPDYSGHLVIAFQSDIFLLANDDTQQKMYGIWKEEGSELILHGAEETMPKNSQGEPFFTRPSGFGPGLIVNLHIVSKSNENMEWTWTNDEGRHYRYKLRHLM